MASVPPAPRVTVVVPVFNPGREIEPCIASLLGQSLPASEYEVIFVDDGSTDTTPERLDDLAAATSNVRVIHMPPSGAPGKPRNVGLDAANGRYVYFVDSDDAIAATALARMTADADRHGSDVVLAKYASASLPRGQGMFGQSRKGLTLRSTPALLDSSLAANKLFRADFLRKAGIRFPEGWRLMEDQYVVLRAYFRARAISVLADQTYYYFRRREDGEHLSAQLLDPVADLDHLRTIVDMVEAESDPGPLRERAIRRLYRAEVLGRLAGEPYAQLDADYRHALFERARAFAIERIDPALDRGLNAFIRLRSTLLRDGREAELLELARRTAAVELRAVVRRAVWRHGRLKLAFHARLVDRASGRSIGVSDEAGARVLDRTLTAGISPEDVPVDDELAAVRGNVVLRERDTAVEWVIPTRLSLSFRNAPASGGPRVRTPVVRGDAIIDPAEVGPADVRLQAGRWAVRVRLNLLGMDQRSDLVVAAPARRLLDRAVLGDPPFVVAPEAEEAFGLIVTPPVAAAGAEPRAGMGVGAPLTVPLPIASDVGARALPAQLVARHGDDVERWPAVARHRFGRLVLEARPATRASGPVRLSASVAGLDAEVDLGTATASRGTFTLDADSATDVVRGQRPIRWLATRLLDEGQRQVDRSLGRAMPLARRVFEATPVGLRSPVLRLTRFLRR